MSFTLVIGNKNYSSWSMRPWLAMKVFGIPFEEILVPLYGAASRPALLSFSPAGKVPALLADGAPIWDSLAILEFLAERFPDRAIWPRDAAARALARSLACEMHSGFTTLRRDCPMNLRRPWAAIDPGERRDGELQRLDAALSDARVRHGAGGAFLFGEFSAADAMFAPVAARIDTYALPVSPALRDWISAVRALPAWREWEQAALAEPWVLEQFEVPVVGPA
jgi:glutathione S-transferase